MTPETKKLVKMGPFFALFFLPIVMFVLSLFSGLLGGSVIENRLRGGRMEGTGFILVVTGLGAGLFGRELFNAIKEWRVMRRQSKRNEKT